MISIFSTDNMTPGALPKSFENGICPNL